jgi:hypothetical protein
MSFNYLFLFMKFVCLLMMSLMNFIMICFFKFYSSFIIHPVSLYYLEEGFIEIFLEKLMILPVSRLGDRRLILL